MNNIQSSTTPSRAASPALYAGRVKWFNPQKGYGFITPDEPGPELFLHISALVHKCIPQEGDAIEFIIEPGPRGPRAAHVRLLAQPNAHNPPAPHPGAADQ